MYVGYLSLTSRSGHNASICTMIDLIAAFFRGAGADGKSGEDEGEGTEGRNWETLEG